MARLLVFALGLLVAVAALYWLGAGEPIPDVAMGPPHDVIDDASRQKLERVLRDAGD